MSNATVNGLRASLRRAAACSRPPHTRCISSTPSSSQPSSSLSKATVKPKTTLSPEKMRVLVDLYHQSENFITLKNLSSKIDEAFITRMDSSYGQRLRPETPPKTFEVEALHRARAPKFADELVLAPELKTSRRKNKDELWSSGRSPLEQALLSTLYGTHASGAPGLPGYDALEEYVEESLKTESDVEAEQDAEGLTVQTGAAREEGAS